MLERCKFLIIAVVLGMICPAIFTSFIQKNTTEIIAYEPTANVQTESDIADVLSISVLMHDGSVRLMNLNEYLTCVVLREMPIKFDIEALKAQAVVARTYALRRSTTGGKHDNAAVCTSADCCQGYWDISEYLNNGGKQVDIEKIQNAVHMTSDLVLVYNGELIDATYFSCSGGVTEDAISVWGEEIPYLQSTESPGEEKAVHYVDTVSFKTKDFLRLLDLGNHRKVDIRNISYTKGGGVDMIAVCGKNFKGTEMRQKLGLRSTAFVISVVADTVTITTKGFGHRVGMSQYGADAMAVSGASFPEILAHYYHETQLVAYNGN